jgi:regulatory protein
MNDPVERAREVCLRLLEAGPRTRKELAAALAKKGVDEVTADDVLDRFVEIGVIDDALFARMWVDSRHRSKGLSGTALSQELRRKGVDEMLVREAVDGLDQEDQVETARALVQRKLPGTRALDPQARIRRLAGMLVRKGYAPGLAFRVVKEELERDGVDVPVMDTDGLSALG